MTVPPSVSRKSSAMKNIPAIECSVFRKANREQFVLQAPGEKEHCGIKLPLLEYFLNEYL